MSDQASHLEDLQIALEYHFHDTGLLHQSLVHRSYVHENPHLEEADNETLEFLGDSVLNLSISHLLFRGFPGYKEGDLSRLRSSIVNERELARVAVQLGLGSFLVLGKGEEMTGGRQKPSLLADTVEALLGAIYLDGGLDAAIHAVAGIFREYLSSGQLDQPLKTLDKDYKTQLQEVIQARFKLTPIYSMESEKGPDHDKTFHMSVSLGGRVLAEGAGKSKKEAQQEAARKAMAEIGPDISEDSSDE